MEWSFRDMQRPMRWLRRVLFLMVAGDLVALAADAYERHVLRQIIAHSFVDVETMRAAAELSDGLQRVTAVLRVLLLVVAYVIGGRWIILAARNVRAFGAQGLAVSPGWAVGWYFIPFANLIKPFQAMDEIWRASASAANWRQVATPTLLRFWWGCWLVVGVLGNASMRFALRAKELDQLLLANAVGIASEIADIALCLAFAAVAVRVTAMQGQQWLSGAIPAPLDGPAMAPVAGPAAPLTS